MSRKYYASRVRLDSGGYDSRGRYWGHHSLPGNILYEVTDDANGDVKHVRARSSEDAKLKAFGYVSSRKKSPSRAGKSSWNVEAKIAEANAVRSQVSSEFLPLFDHLLSLARNDAKHGHTKSAGQLVGKAKAMAKKYPKTSGDRSRRRPKAKIRRRAPASRRRTTKRRSRR